MCYDCVVVVFYHCLTIFVLKLVCCFDSDNDLDNKGAKYIAEVLKVNTTLTSIVMSRKSIVFLYFIFDVFYFIFKTFLHLIGS